MMGDVFLQERQDTVIDSDNIVIIIVAAAAFIGQLIAVFIGMYYVLHMLGSCALFQHCILYGTKNKQNNFKVIY